MSTLLRRLRAEGGIALPLALGVMVATGAMVVSIVEYSSSSGRTANLAKAGISAESLAEAGLANAFAVLNNEPEQPRLGDVARLRCGRDDVHADRLDLPGRDRHLVRRRSTRDVDLDDHLHRRGPEPDRRVRGEEDADGDGAARGRRRHAERLRLELRVLDAAAGRGL